MAIFPGKPGLAGYTGAKDDGSCGDSWSCKASSQIAITKNQLFTGCMSFT